MIELGDSLSTTNYDGPSGSQGWQLNKNGTAFFNNVVVSRPQIVDSGTVLPRLKYILVYPEGGGDAQWVPAREDQYDSATLGYVDIPTNYTYASGDNVFNVQATITADATAWNGYAWWGGGGPGTSPHCNWELRCEVRRSATFYATGVQGTPMGSLIIRVYAQPTNVHYQIYKLRLDEIQWALKNVV
jgi:hypothetical protein